MDFTVPLSKYANMSRTRPGSVGGADIHLERDDRVYDGVQSSHRRGRFSEQHRYL